MAEFLPSSALAFLYLFMAEVDWELGEIEQGPDKDLLRWTPETGEARDESISLWLQPRVRQDILQMAILAGSVPAGLLDEIAALQPTIELAPHAERMITLTPKEGSKIIEKCWSIKRAARRHVHRILAKGAMADAVVEVQRLKANRTMLSTLSSARVKKSPNFRLLWVKWMPRIVEGAEATETDKEDANQDLNKPADVQGGEELVVVSTRKLVAALLDACIIQSDVQEGHFQGVLTELFEDSLGDVTILQIPSGGIKSLVHRRLKVASMCELDWWKRAR